LNHSNDFLSKILFADETWTRIHGINTVIREATQISVLTDQIVQKLVRVLKEKYGVHN